MRSFQYAWVYLNEVNLRDFISEILHESDIGIAKLHCPYLQVDILIHPG